MLDLAVLYKILESNNKEYIGLYSKDFFIDEYVKAWEYVQSHYKKFKAYPKIETVLHESFIKIARHDIDSINESIGYYIEKFNNRYLTMQLKSKLESPSKLINSNPNEAYNQIRLMVKELSMKFKQQDGILLDWTDPNHTSERVAEYFNQKQNPNQLRGYPTPWPSINEQTCGIEPGTFWAIVAKLKTGKTWMIGPILARYLWENEVRCLLVTPEISVKAMANRLDATVAKLNYREFRKHQLSKTEEDTYVDYANHLHEMGPLYIAGNGRVKNMMDIEILIDQIEPQVVLIDGIYFLNPRDGKEYDKYKRVSRLCEEIHTLVEQSKIAIVATSQFRRDIKGDMISGEASDIGFAYEIAQYAHVLIGIFRNDYLARNKQMVFRIMEVRDGERVNVLINFDLDNMCFDEIGTFSGDDIKNIVINNQSQTSGIL